MNRWKFRKLFDVLESRVKEEGKKSPSWFLGFLEGLGNRKLKGVQVGALVNLLLVTDKEVSFDVPEMVVESDYETFDFLKNLS